MHRPASSYSISNLISKAIEGLPCDVLASLLGLRNTPKMLRRLDCWLLHGSGDAYFLSTMVQVGLLELPKVINALNTTSRELAAEEAANSAKMLEVWLRDFRPYLFAHTEREVSASFFSGLLSNSLKHIPLKIESLTLSRNELRALAVERIRQHFSMNDGELSVFGAITGYSLVESVNSHSRFTVDGKIVAEGQGYFVAPLPERGRVTPYLEKGME